jgi:hypothetical protein
VYHPHALAAAACGWLDEDGEADLRRAADQIVVGKAGSGNARHHGYSERRNGCLGRNLVAHGLNRRHRRSDERDTCPLQRLREFGVLREESVAGVDRLGPRSPDGIEERVDGQVALPGRRGADADGDVRLGDVPGTRVGVAVDGDGTNAHRPQRADDPHGNLAAVGDQHGVECLGGHGVTS